MTDARHERPNIVVVLADDLGFSDLGCYGSEIHTPALNALAERGLRFTQMYNAARCCPSRAALLTGLYPHQAGVGDMVLPGPTRAYQGFLDDGCVTIAEVLQAAGYATLMAGKWHVGGRYAGLPQEPAPGSTRHPIPTQRGFDEFYGTLEGAGSYFQPATLVRGDQRIEQRDPDWYYTDAVTDEALRMVDGAVATGRPFFLYLAYTAPHWPLHAVDEDIERYRGAYDAGWDRIRAARHEEQRALGVVDPRWPISTRDSAAPPWDAVDDQAVEAHRMAVYAAQVDRMDQGVGRLVQRLDGLGLLDDTLLCFLSDNGGSAELLGANVGRVLPGLVPEATLDGRPVAPGNRSDVWPGGPDSYASYGLPWANVSNAPFRRFKQWVHEGGISTPMIVHWPRVVKAPGLVRTPCHIIDLMPTCLEAAGVTAPPLEGRSLLPALRDPAWTRSSPLLFEHEGNRALIDDQWKLVAAAGGPWELYDVQGDRTELVDLAAGERRRVDAMSAEWLAWAERIGVLVGT